MRFNAAGLDMTIGTEAGMSLEAVTTSWITILPMTSCLIKKCSQKMEPINWSVSAGYCLQVAANFSLTQLWPPSSMSNVADDRDPLTGNTATPGSA